MNCSVNLGGNGMVSGSSTIFGACFNGCVAVESLEIEGKRNLDN